MSSLASVAIHASQFPENVRRDLFESLRSRRVNHKFLYDSLRQTQKWLALHEAHSPARNDADCLATYKRAFIEATKKIAARRVHVLGLGCGGGQKDVSLLKLLKARGKEIFYTPCDVSTAMTLVARKKALSILPAENCFPLVCDLATAGDLPSALASRLVAPKRSEGGITHHAPRITTFFGMIPNFEPQNILPKLAAFVRPKDFLLVSANLAPGKSYAAGLKKILPQYDNALTRDWLMTFLLDLGVENGDGELRFTIEDGKMGLKRVMARFHFIRKRLFEIESEKFEFPRGDAVQIFFSYRYTPERVRDLLGRNGMCVLDQWITKSKEEGVFFVKRG